MMEIVSIVTNLTEADLKIIILGLNDKASDFLQVIHFTRIRHS